MKLKLKKLARLLAVTAVAYSATLVGAATFRSADVHPKDYPTVQAVIYMGEQLSKATGGKDNDQGLQRQRAGLREGHRRAGQDRRARHGPRQHRRRSTASCPSR